MKRKIIVKNAKEEEIDKIVKLENEIWPEGTRATKNKFISRLDIFPNGFFLAYKNNLLIGVSTSEIINYNLLKSPTSWEAITDNGYIKKTHNPKGNALYVVSVGAKSRSGGGSALVQAQKSLVEKLNLKFLILGARISGYDKYCKTNEEISIEKYVRLKRENNELFDPELRFYTRNELSLVKIISNYMEDDKESRNYGAIMAWQNPKFKIKR